MCDELFPSARAMRTALQEQLRLISISPDGSQAVGRTLRTLRAMSGITIEDLALRTGLARERLDSLERGDASVTSAEAMRIIAELDGLVADRQRRYNGRPAIESSGD